MPIEGLADLKPEADLTRDAHSADANAEPDDEALASTFRDAEIVDTPNRCQAVCDALFAEDTLALDIEGVALSRFGEICIVQVATRSGQVFLFDVTVLGKEVFNDSLQRVLEAEAIRKLLWDCRSDADALKHVHGVSLKNILDIQILYAKKFATGPDGRAHSLCRYEHALQAVVSSADQTRAAEIKKRGKAMFAPEAGGTYEVWKRRPLPHILRAYCALDVVHMFEMLGRWSDALTIPRLRLLSEQRMRARVDQSDADRKMFREQGLDRYCDLSFNEEFLEKLEREHKQQAEEQVEEEEPSAKRRRVDGNTGTE